MLVARKLSMVACLLGLLPGHHALADDADFVATTHPIAGNVVDKLLQGVDLRHELIWSENDTFHSRELKPSALSLLLDAKVIIVIGMDEPGYLQPKRLQELTGGNAAIVDLAAAVDGLIDHCEDDGHAEQHQRQHCLDPHYWLGMDNLRQANRTIATQLAKAWPGHAEPIWANQRKMATGLDDLEQELRDVLEHGDNFKTIVWHDAYAYFTRHFGLSGHLSMQQADTESHSISGARLRALIEALDDNTCLVFSSAAQRDTYLPILLEEEPGLRHTVSNPLGKGLTRRADLLAALLRNVAGAFANCGAGLGSADQVTAGK